MLLCLLGAVHVFFFSASLPFFSTPDEQVHFDLAVRYSQGDIPRTLTPPSDEALRFIAIYGTPEYLWPPATQPGGKIPPPPWKQPVAAAQKELLAKEADYKSRFKDDEAASPPLYYALAGGWWRLGHAIKLDGGQLLYWLRFLNTPLVVALVLLGWLTARAIFPENVFIRLAVPAIIAFLPQSTFYAINNDILTPLTFGIAFVLLVKFFEAPRLSPLFGFIAGLALAAAYLSKTSNLPLVVAAGVFIVWKTLGLMRAGKPGHPLVSLGLLILAAAVPIAAWMTWCRTNFGDLTGSSLKLSLLGWTPKPWAEWWHHPLFTGAGFWFFVKQNLATFWQGELVWQRQPLTIPGVDSAYAVLTLGLVALALAAWLSRPSPFTTSQRPAVGFAFLCLVASFAFFALLSVRFNFHDSNYPSTAHPFFVSGRLMLGMLVPLLILFVCGLDRLMNRFHNLTKFCVLLALLGFMTASEWTIDNPVLFNEYNWFHL